MWLMSSSVSPNAAAHTGHCLRERGEAGGEATARGDRRPEERTGGLEARGDSSLSGTPGNGAAGSSSRLPMEARGERSLKERGESSARAPEERERMLAMLNERGLTFSPGGEAVGDDALIGRPVLQSEKERCDTSSSDASNCI